jgi:hypothetical protein
MVVYNQFRILISKDRISKEDLLDLIRQHTKIIDERSDRIKVKYKAGHLDPFIEWDIYINVQENDFEVLMENPSKPGTNYEYLTLFAGRKLLETIESTVNK